MAYSEFQAQNGGADYQGHLAGAGIALELLEDGSTAPILAAFSGGSYQDDFETLPIEEVGESLTTEHVHGRHSGTGSMNGFTSFSTLDALPTPSAFIGRRFTIFARASEGRPGAGNLLYVLVGVVISGMSANQGARGALTFDVRYSYQKRLSGAEWAAETGA